MDSKENNQAEKNIVFVVGGLLNGGIERSVTEWCIYLKKNTAWSPTVVCLLKKKGPFLAILENNNIPVIECQLKNKGMMPFTVRLGRLLRDIKPDVVHSQVAFSLLWQTMGFLLGGVKHIVFTQQNEYQNWNSFLAKARLRFYYLLSSPFIDHYTCVSEKVRTNISGLLGVSPERFTVINNSVNTNVFYPNKSLRAQARERAGIYDGSFVMGVVARFAPQKGHQYILEACALLNKENFAAYKLVLIGNGDYSELQGKTKALHIENEVIFLGNRADVDVLLQGFDCFVLPSLWEGLPLALIEAMACQLPVIATNVSGNSEVIEHEKTGLLVSPADPGALKEAIKRIYENPEMATKLAYNGHIMVMKRFHLHQAIAQYISLYG